MIHSIAPKMRKFTFILFTFTILTIATACSKDDSNVPSIVGTWELTTWSINVPIDLNNDLITSTDLLDEAICANEETLVFEANGTVSSNATYNPQVMVSLLDGTTEEYLFNVECDTEGSIGIAGSFTQNDQSVTLFNTMATLSGNQLIVVYENAIDVYNQNLTEVIDMKDLILIYTKKL
jgi:hypothetical protein